ncbi:MAG: PGF-pre-PGF domain-containing protein [Methanolobus sp.]
MPVQQDENCIFSDYTFLENYEDSCILTVMIDDGTSVQSNEWKLDVVPVFDVIFSPDEETITSRLDRIPEFATNSSQASDVFWYLDDEPVRTSNDVTNSSYTPSHSDTGNYSISVHVSNDNGTVWKNWQWTATPTPSQVMSGGGGGGSSSGSVLSGEDYENIRLKDVQMHVVNKGTVTSYSFPEEINPVDSVEFVSSVNSGYVKTTIEVLKNMSSSVSNSPEDTVYCYSNIILGNTALENKLTDTRIVFHVDREWIDENNIDVSSIRLNVFGESNWKKFPVVLIDQSDQTLCFASTTTEFGSFAITGKVNEEPDDEPIIVDMNGNADAGKDDGSQDVSNNGQSAPSGEDVWGSVLNSMKELFIKRNPLNS